MFTKLEMMIYPIFTTLVCLLFSCSTTNNSEIEYRLKLYLDQVKHDSIVVKSFGPYYTNGVLNNIEDGLVQIPKSILAFGSCEVQLYSTLKKDEFESVIELLEGRSKLVVNLDSVNEEYIQKATNELLILKKGVYMPSVFRQVRLTKKFKPIDSKVYLLESGTGVVLEDKITQQFNPKWFENEHGYSSGVIVNHQSMKIMIWNMIW